MKVLFYLNVWEIDMIKHMVLLSMVVDVSKVQYFNSET